MNIGGNPPPRGVWGFIQAAFQRKGRVQKNATVNQDRRVKQVCNTHFPHMPHRIRGAGSDMYLFIVIVNNNAVQAMA